jgi:hypothetical protein
MGTEHIPGGPRQLVARARRRVRAITAAAVAVATVSSLALAW